ncbi:LANO_0G13894g1_1 [Lachancea nothofagi CBS 11611]|uniref:LANO_0G13894g1_1 n=1 Tax=Lachancea nothofagi CBS 11611 TaxID=1266666 RepID=A0A1G4KK34_9SACH|nr:LANO_0G13894g1_1 [Lachancea nothofagi CBS 11611]
MTSTPVESQDLEQQPLQPAQQNHYGATLPQLQRKVHKKRFRKELKLLGSILVVFSLLVVVVLWASRFIPSEDLIQKYYEDVTKFEIHSIKYEGWQSDEDSEEGEHKELSATKVGTFNILKLRAKVGVHFDHDRAINIANASVNVQRQQKAIRFFSQTVVRTLCFELNNMTAYNDNETSTQGLGSVSIPQRVCVELQSNKTTELDLPILIRPDSQNVASVIIKIWKHRFKDLNLWSSFDVSLSKWGLALGKIQISHLDWDEIFNWKQVESYVDNIQAAFKEPITVDDMEIIDHQEAVDFHVAISYTTPEDIQKFLGFEKDAMIPSTSWKVRMPGCNEDDPILLQNAVFKTPTILVNDLLSSEATSLNISGRIWGPLPDKLLYQVCDSDEENVVTPINLFLNKVFNATESVQFEICGHSSESSNQSIIPKQILDKLLPSVSEAISANLTLNSDELVEQVSVNGLKLKWVQKGWGDKKLAITGEVISIVNLPFYNSAHSGAKATVSIQKIKGLTKLFHNNVHFITVPMDVWLSADSEILPTRDPSHNQLRVSFDIADQDVVVVDSLELSRCLNEILVKGQTGVHVEGNLDLMIDTRLGSLVLLGLEGDGNTIIRK